MLTFLIRLLLGYCHITVECADPVRILNRLHRQKLYFRKPRLADCALRFTCTKRNAPIIYRMLIGMGVHDIKVKGVGLPFLLLTARRKIAFALMLTLLIATPLVSRLFLAEIVVEGNSALSSESILTALEEVGVREYAYIPRLELKNARQQLLLLQPRLSFAALNLKGNRLEVLVHEKTGSAPIMPETPCNIVAASDGIICHMEVLSGKQIVKGKTAVKKGQLLVSGFMETETGKLSYLHAQATVIAEIEIQKSYTVDLCAVEYLPLEKGVTRYRLKLFGVWIPLLPNTSLPSHPYTLACKRYDMRLFDTMLPFSLQKEQYTLYEQTTASLTKTDAAAILQARFAEYEIYELSDAAILKKGFETVESGSKITVIGHYRIQRDIAQSVEIAVKE